MVLVITLVFLLRHSIGMRSSEVVAKELAAGTFPFSGVASSCDSWTEQDIDDVENKGSKRTRKRRGSKQSSKTKGKEQNFVKRNIEV